MERSHMPKRTTKAAKYIYIHGLKLNIQKTKIIASGLITSWQIYGETTETVTDFISWASELLQMVTTAMKLKDTPCKRSCDQLR